VCITMFPCLPRPRKRGTLHGWRPPRPSGCRPCVARFAVAAFRADIARAGASANVQELVDELRRLSPEFEMMWRENDVRTHGGGTKHFRHPVAGVLAVEYSAFSIDGRPDLSLVVYNPATPKDVNKICGLIKSLSKT